MWHFHYIFPLKRGHSYKYKAIFLVHLWWPYKRGTTLHKSEGKRYLTVNVFVADEVSQAVNLSVLYSNRAACKLKTGDCHDCVTDCTKALDLVPGSVKPLLRRAAAYETLEKYEIVINSLL